MLPDSALIYLFLFFLLLSRCSKDVLFNLRVSSLTESDLYEDSLCYCSFIFVVFVFLVWFGFHAPVGAL